MCRPPPPGSRGPRAVQCTTLSATRFRSRRPLQSSCESEELDKSWSVGARYTQSLGIDEPLAMYRGGAGYVYHADGLGSIGGLTDATGNIAATYTYDSFGNLTASTGTVTNPYRYTARGFDTETGIYYYRARYYFQGVGRFASEDPDGFEGGINFYNYVSNRVLGYTDPMGLSQRDVQLIFDQFAK